jgi:hypothetical protein
MPVNYRPHTLCGWTVTGTQKLMAHLCFSGYKATIAWSGYLMMGQGMSDIVKSTISVDKVFFRKERDQFYGNWVMAFWRELFQNSVDAGSKSISISLEDKPARGAFGAPADPNKNVTNVVFADDGHGMSAETLNDVYFKMGKSTKDAEDGSTIGGFGRARIMTCFSQERYTILTKDRFVMGDGVHFEHGSLDQQIEELLKYVWELENVEGEASRISADALRRDLEILTEANARRAGFKGCRVEVDLDASPSESWRATPGNFENMQAALRQYLSESQLPCSVTINGQTPEAFFDITGSKLQARKGPVRRVLTAETDDGEKAFATVHLGPVNKELSRGKVIVRVSGASMYTKLVNGLQCQVIVEIDPTLSRAALNSNRDGLKGGFDRSLDKLISELTVDTMSALKSKEGVVEKFAGSKGLLHAKPPQLDDVLEAELSEDDVKQLFSRIKTAPKITSYESLSNVGVHQDALKAFIEKTYFGSSFLNRYVDSIGYKFEYTPFEKEIKALHDGLYASKRNVAWFFENSGSDARAWVLNMLAIKIEQAKNAEAKANDKTLEGVHDIYINMESTNKKTKAAARRHHPANWDVTTGAGRSARSLLATWTAACNVAVEALYSVRPALGSIFWSTGFVYSLPEEVNQGDQYRNVAIKAQCVHLGSGDIRMLINPVNEDGTLRYSPTNEADMRRILALALHEVAHIVETSHEERFANVLTDLMAEVDPKVAFKRMKAEYSAVMAAYAEGKSKVHALDNQKGIRPAERLLALAYGNDLNHAREVLEYARVSDNSVEADEIIDHVVQRDEERVATHSNPKVMKHRDWR